MVNVSIVRAILITSRVSWVKGKAMTKHFITTPTYDDIITGVEGLTHMCKPRRKSRVQEKCRKRLCRISTDNDILYLLIGCETCMQYWVAGLKLFWRDRDENSHC
jgi:hypothetical protein